MGGGGRRQTGKNRRAVRHVTNRGAGGVRALPGQAQVQSGQRPVGQPGVEGGQEGIAVELTPTIATAINTTRVLPGIAPTP